MRTHGCTGIEAIDNQAVYAASKHGITGWNNSIQQVRGLDLLACLPFSMAVP